MAEISDGQLDRVSLAAYWRYLLWNLLCVVVPMFLVGFAMSAGWGFHVASSNLPRDGALPAHLQFMVTLLSILIALIGSFFALRLALRGVIGTGLLQVRNGEGG